MQTKTIFYRNDFLRPVGPQATQSLLDQQTIPALDEPEYQEWADYLFDAPKPLRLRVAETLLSL